MLPFRPYLINVYSACVIKISPVFLLIKTKIPTATGMGANRMQMAIVFPFSADDKESISSSGGDAKTKGSSTAVSNSTSSKNTNSIFNESSDKAGSSSKSSPSIEPTTSSSCTKSAETVNEQNKASPTAKTNNCDALSDVIIDASGIKLEIKDDPDAPKTAKSVNNIQPALGGSLLPPHAANAKNPVSTNIFLRTF